MDDRLGDSGSLDDAWTKWRKRLLTESWCGAVYGPGIEPAAAGLMVVTGLCMSCHGDGNEVCKSAVLCGAGMLRASFTDVAATLYQPFAGAKVSPFIDMTKPAEKLARLQQVGGKAPVWLRRLCDRGRRGMDWGLDRFRSRVNEGPILLAIQKHWDRIMDPAMVARHSTSIIGDVSKVADDLRDTLGKLKPSLIKPRIIKLRTYTRVVPARPGVFDRNDIDRKPQGKSDGLDDKDK